MDFLENKLTGQIPFISSLTQLQVLDLGYNQLTGQMPSLSSITQLQILNLAGTQVTALALLSHATADLEPCRQPTHGADSIPLHSHRPDTIAPQR
ncbi:hypothetical protein M427DRAFT_63903 [Gonapodya prolifera JEL478]|uniref:L domain-like protein n=1 Tax=Gonapodya prolifera (strain JEL478) TaxID=1344416 RepID=A0A138ZZG5_GONPJ|nr:hypothetical protein M427DRAFT_63903 [Gonapodya prolifera JEL478]|eukprot:KXS09523.1 hypothetical protein M427DRAFT_63903 [Gonapodya prolifera JEL478]